MLQDGHSCDEESFNSFLAGMFLTRKSIKNFEFFNLMNSFSDNYGVEIVTVGNDIDVSLCFDNDTVKLLDDIDDVRIINNQQITIKEYLYSITSSRVREFFKISDAENKKIDLNKSKSMVKSLFRKKVSI